MSEPQIKWRGGTLPACVGEERDYFVEGSLPAPMFNHEQRLTFAAKDGALSARVVLQACDYIEKELRSWAADLNGV